MKQGGRHFTLEQKLEMASRDGYRCVLCGQTPQDADHSFRLSTQLPYIEDTWNGNLLCRACHTDVTLPDNAAKWLKSLKVIELALWRLYRVHPKRVEHAHHHRHYLNRVSRFFELYPEEAKKHYGKKPRKLRVE